MVFATVIESERLNASAALSATVPVPSRVPELLPLPICNVPELIVIVPPPILLVPDRIQSPVPFFVKLCPLDPVVILPLMILFPVFEPSSTKVRMLLTLTAPMDNVAAEFVALLMNV